MEELKQRIKAQFAENYHIDIISEQSSKKIISYQTIQDDLKFCHQLMNCLKDSSVPEIMKSATTYTLISLYGRCFTDASNHKKPKLETSIFKENESLLESHNELITLRHNFVAHRGESDGEKAILFMITPKIHSRESILKYERKRLSRFSSDKLSQYEVLIEFVIIQIENKLRKLGEKLYNKFYDNPSTLIDQPEC